MLEGKKVFLTGGTGLFSTNAARILRDECEVFCLSRDPRLKIKNVNYLFIDLADFISTKKAFESIEPDLVINAAGLTSVELCEKDYFKAYTSNVLVAKNLSNLTRDTETKLIHISTDHFSDSNVFKSTEDQVELPRNNYAATKMEADRFVISNDSTAIIARTNFYGWGHKGRSSFSDFIISNLRQGRPVSLFEDVIYSPILIDQLVEDIKMLYLNGGKGVFNICSSEPITKYHFGELIAQEFGLNTGLIKPCLLRNRKDLVNRPFDMSLSNEKLRKTLGINKYPSIREMITKLKLSELEAYEINSGYLEKKSMLSYGQQHIDDSDIDRVVNVVCNKNLTQGDEVEKFEEEILKRVGAKYAVAVCNWTAGLHLSCLALGIGPGDKVITTPNTFVASANCVKYVGGEVLLCDIDQISLNICTKKLEELLKIHPEVKAVIPVHFAGAPCDMNKIKELSKIYGFSIIEDAAHALGGKYQNNTPIGTCEFADIVGFSFHPVKNIACGEGGCIVTNSEEIYKKLVRLRSHGIAKGDDEIQNKENAYDEGVKNPWYYEMLELGYNYRITDIQCALGISQIQKLEYFMSKRRELAILYDELLAEVNGVFVPQKSSRLISGNHLYTIQIPFEELGMSKNLFYHKMKARGVNLHLHYIPIHLQPYYEYIDSSGLESSLEVYTRSVTLPLHVGLTKNEVRFVVRSLIECLKNE